MIRSFLYDDPNTNDRQYIYGPRIEEINGNEPTIASLINFNTNLADAYFSGKVGIKTKTPGDYDLAVNGKIRAHEIKVESTVSTWPDYVFKDDYQLPSLAETEKFIQNNGHLPEVPKAEVVGIEGYSLNEMDKILLKKIEELTLHLIEKDARLKKVEKKLLELESIHK